VHPHADGLAIEANGALIFPSSGRRPAGAQPKHEDIHDSDKGKENKGNKDNKDRSEKVESMIYMAFAPGTWRLVFAAKLQDRSPASVEHRPKIC
jgi:hypothetical protein